ncbi:hypothetical protein LEP1GSC187_1270 [Leptospira santarosai str. ZUN179]|uniref:Uncharacterized protein n=1 Tax=Leptospira santarosai str. ZUN179 TaxID=1049985 RepID=M6UFS0_9LEPT|nr:hypothetical protein LEP1GSC187_1270 [Leptospira santarosai str. ZUN179]
MPSLKEELNISLLEKHQAWHEARGAESTPKVVSRLRKTGPLLKNVK